MYLNHFLHNITFHTKHFLTIRKARSPHLLSFCQTFGLLPMTDFFSLIRSKVAVSVVLAI